MMEVVKLIPKMMVVSMTAPGMMVDVTRQAMRMIGTVTTARMMVVVMTAPWMVLNVTRKAMGMMVVWTECRRNVGRRWDSLTKIKDRNKKN